MQLTVDSSGCAKCHNSTFGQWTNTTHAQAGVQCIGCHLSHSQTLRVTDKKLCDSCHRDQTEDFFHLAHRATEVTCIRCHLDVPSNQVAGTSPGGISTVSQVSTAGNDIPAPGHDFTAVAGQNCVACHSQDAYAPSEDRVAREQLLAMVNQMPELTAQLDTAQETNKSLRTITFIALGLGIAAGSLFGVALTLVVGYISQGRAKQ